MAAIIAQITRANRERIEKRKFEIISSKCLYEIIPFDRNGFDPMVSRITLGQICEGSSI